MTTAQPQPNAAHAAHAAAAATAANPATPATPAIPAAPALLVFGITRLPREAVRARLSSLFALAFSEADSLYLGPYAAAEDPATQERFQLHQNFNVLENAWLEDTARDCSVLLYIGQVTDPARSHHYRHQILAHFPTARLLRCEAEWNFV